MLRLVVGALLLVLAFAGGYAVAACKTVTLTVDGTAMRVTTMKSRVIDIVEENGFSVDDRDDLYPAAGVQVHDADTIVLRRSRPLQISLDGHDAKQVWTTASTVDEALAQLAMTDTAPAAASRASRVPLSGMALPVVSAKTVQLNDGGLVRTVHLPAPMSRAAECGRRAAVAKRPRGARRDGPDRRRHADPGDPQSDQEGHRAAAAAAERASCRGPGDEHEPGGRRRPGVPGTQDVTFAVAEVNGVETGRLPVANVVVTPAHEAVVRVGTKPGTEVPR
ncbi:resuscitation-promoting factor RpfB [Mycobacterium tuberculosis variant africanum]|nr:resuscitation-promoting factor RpfB [Mycobacterium tuberculosis variant africanum]